MIDNYKDWHEQLSYALLGYHTTARTSTGATPYLLVYGTETVIPAEVETLSLQIIQEAELDDTEWICKRYEQLALIDEKRMIVVCHVIYLLNPVSDLKSKNDSFELAWLDYETVKLDICLK
ncbi:uncharacterized protein LOC132601581 [Lycium barbarum]|uniref:uncharacterized protein LOC132601581 n=1 Tax=Lycium barbarum TaxID=112863 RepID=UPI00293F6C46|nr:uncharacterized protein LOC132601581 [Lycium barbarum]